MLAASVLFVFVEFLAKWLPVDALFFCFKEEEWDCVDMGKQQGG